MISLAALVRGTELEIRIADTGKGIERDMLEKVFELFVQIDPLANDTMGGLGVGLALVRRIIELHGGNVLARSEGPGRGTDLIVRLPLASAQVRPITSAIAAVAGKLPQLKVLVVDDNRDAADTLALLLEAMGQQVTAVYDGPTAVSMAWKFKPDVILTDIGMPRMSGYAVARAIRSAMPVDSPVLAAVTGWGQETDKARAEDAGFRYHFVKPVSDDMLRQLLTEVASAKDGRA
jgi:CheY-like chemotaxis protein